MAAAKRRKNNPSSANRNRSNRRPGLWPAGHSALCMTAITGIRISASKDRTIQCVVPESTITTSGRSRTAVPTTLSP
ncbi:MAG: hypothetical protein WBQ86_11040 [Candidatus Binatus sp.]